MAPLDDLPLLPHVDPVTRVGAILRGERVGAIRLPPGVQPPAGRRLRSAWQRRRSQPGEPEGPESEPVAASLPEPKIEVNPPETYGEHGELHHAAGSEGTPAPRMDLEV